MRQADCLFCKIAAGEIPAAKIYEDEKFLAFLDITPVNPGHILVMPKEHYENILDVPAEVLQELILIVQKMVVLIKEKLSAEGINIGQNNFAAGGQSVNHLHFHVMPRYTGDGYELWLGKSYKEGEKEEILRKLKT